MDSGGCYLGLGLFLGILIGALFIQGNAQRRNAMSKVQAVEAEKAKAKDAIQKAQARRQQGLDEMIGAYLLMFLALIILILTAYVLATAGIAVF